MSDDEYLDSYSRAEAIAEGVLHDVSEAAAAQGVRLPMAIAQYAWGELVDNDAEGSLEARRDALIAETARVMKEQRRTESDTIAFVYSALPLYVRIHGGDNHEPVLTVMHQLDL